MTTKDIPDTTAAKWVRLIASVLVVPLFVWGITIERRVTRIEANRFTSGDAIVMYEKLNEKADRRDVPPPVVKEAIERLESDMREVKQDVKTLLQRGLP